MPELIIESIAEKRASSLARATEVRKDVSEVKAQLRSGTMSIAEALIDPRVQRVDATMHSARRSAPCFHF